MKKRGDGGYSLAAEKTAESRVSTGVTKANGGNMWTDLPVQDQNMYKAADSHRMFAKMVNGKQVGFKS